MPNDPENPTEKFIPLKAEIPMKINPEDILATYEPEKQFQFAGNGKTPYQEFIEKHYFKKTDGGFEKINPEGLALTGDVLAVQMQENDEGVMEHRLVKVPIRSAADFKAFLEKAEAKERNLKETNFIGPGSYPFDGSGEGDYASSVQIANGDVEYTPIMGGPFSKQLYLFDYLTMHARCFEMWNHNPVAHQIVKITTYFVLGRGFKVKFKNAAAQKNWDTFSEKNDFDNRLKTWCDQESRDGELMIRIYKDPLGQTGEILVRAVDPSTIWEIVTDNEDIEKVYYYHQQYPTAYQVFYAQNMINLPSTQYVIHQIPAGEMLHYKLNCNSNEKRGRSDLYPVMTWLKRLKDFYTARVIRAIMQSCVVWKNIIKGDAADIQTYINNYGTNPPKAGTLHVENEASTLSTMTVDIKAADARDDGDALLNLISVGVGIPKEYLGLGDRSTRATALVASEPGAKKFQDRQEHYKKIITDVAKIVTTEAMKARKIPGTEKVMPADVSKKIVMAVKAMDYWTAIKLLWAATTGGQVQPIDETFEVIMPEIILEDRTGKIKDLTMMQVNEWICKETAAVIAAKEMHIENYDYAEEAAKIAKDVAQGNPYGQYEPMMSPTGGVKYKPQGTDTGTDSKNPLAAKPGAKPGAPKPPTAGLGSAERTQTKQDMKQAEAAIKESAAAKLPDSEFDPEQLKIGTEHEKEHTDDPEVAKAIAKDHLAEHPDYYIELAKMEQKLKDKEGKK